jgi:hypothetical protein
MTREELLIKMNEMVGECPSEDGHQELDYMLLDYIGDEEIKKVFISIEKWYA